jgi:hypothetical protein
MTSLATNTGLCVWVVESTPASNVARCVGIGIGCEAARLARELVACWTVFIADASTRRASPARVAFDIAALLCYLDWNKCKQDPKLPKTNAIEKGIENVSATAQKIGIGEIIKSGWHRIRKHCISGGLTLKKRNEILTVPKNQSESYGLPLLISLAGNASVVDSLIGGLYKLTIFTVVAARKCVNTVQTNSTITPSTSNNLKLPTLPNINFSAPTAMSSSDTKTESIERLNLHRQFHCVNLFQTIEYVNT